MVFRSILMSISMSISNYLSVKARGGSVDNVKSNFMILVKLDVSLQQNVKLCSKLGLLQCCSIREAVENVEGWLC